MSELKGNQNTSQCSSFNFSYEGIKVLKYDVMCPRSSNQGGGQMTDKEKQV